jgi:medium-chain acyl-[acyl-carrier-protein] hydrolase
MAAVHDLPDGELDDPEVSREALEAWREQTGDRFVARLFPGDHFFVVEQAPLVLQALVRDLAGAVPV